MNFETVRIHFLSGVFVLLSSRNLATMATWRNDFSSLLEKEFKFQRRSCKLSFLIFSCLTPKLAPKGSRELQPWTKKMENLYPASPQINSEKMARFGFCAASSLISGGCGFAFPFYSVQDCCSPCTRESRDSAPRRHIRKREDPGDEIVWFGGGGGGSWR